MTIHFIGAGPGAADLITLRGATLLGRCPVCLYAGSTVAPEMLAHCPPGARLIDTAPLDLDQIDAACVRATTAGEDVARLHSGDLSLWSALAEQMRRLDARGIDYTLTPGVPAFAAAAAALGRELTLPALAQTVVLTRVSGRASPVPPGESLALYARTGATLALHLAIHAIDRIVEELTPVLGGQAPVAVVIRATWPEQQVLRGTLATIGELVRRAGVTRSALILVGRGLGAQDFRDSALYDPSYVRRFKKGEGSALDSLGLEAPDPHPLRGL